MVFYSVARVNYVFHWLKPHLSVILLAVVTNTYWNMIHGTGQELIKKLERFEGTYVATD